MTIIYNIIQMMPIMVSIIQFTIIKFDSYPPSWANMSIIAYKPPKIIVYKGWIGINTSDEWRSNVPNRKPSNGCPAQ